MEIYIISSTDEDIDAQRKQVFTTFKYAFAISNKPPKQTCWRVVILPRDISLPRENYIRDVVLGRRALVSCSIS